MGRLRQGHDDGSYLVSVESIALGMWRYLVKIAVLGRCYPTTIVHLFTFSKHSGQEESGVHPGNAGCTTSLDSPVRVSVTGRSTVRRCKCLVLKCCVR